MKKKRCDMTGQEAAEDALAEAQQAHARLDQEERRMRPVLDRIDKAVEENAIFAKFMETLR